MTQPTAKRVPAASKQRFIVLATILGNSLEWFDFILFGMMAPFFVSLFFPASPLIQPQVIHSKVFGETKPVASNATETGRQQNRIAGKIVEEFAL